MSITPAQRSNEISYVIDKTNDIIGGEYDKEESSNWDNSNEATRSGAELLLNIRIPGPPCIWQLRAGESGAAVLRTILASETTEMGVHLEEGGKGW